MNEEEMITHSLTEHFFRLRDMHSAALETLKTKAFFGYRLFACGKMSATFIIFSPRLRSFTLLGINYLGCFERFYKPADIPEHINSDIDDRPGPKVPVAEINVLELLIKSFDKKQLRISFGY